MNKDQPVTNLITIEVNINSTLERVWEYWTVPHHIMHWNTASDDWQTTYAENDPVSGGKFSSRMEAKDGSFGFDFWGNHTRVEKHSLIESAMGDGRKMIVKFTPAGSAVIVTESFEAENENSLELQRTGWLSILENFKKYCENPTNLKHLHFEISISSPAEKVVSVMLEPETYRVWTAIFNPDSRYIGSWTKGSKILFTGTDGDGNTGGMVSWIKENIHGKFVSIEHQGVLKDGKEITEGPEASHWKGSLENYSFVSAGGLTLLSVDIDSTTEFISYFSDTWPQALNRIKSLCEDR